MRRPGARFSLRHLLIAVALVAALMAAFQAGRRWERVEYRASLYRVLVSGQPEERSWWQCLRDAFE